MDWEQIIDSLMELVKDEETRTDIYKTILEASDEVDEQYIEDTVHGVDDAFDNAWTLYQDNLTSDDEEEEEDEEDNDYETDDDWEIEETEE
jgi:hypothetical protein